MATKSKMQQKGSRKPLTADDIQVGKVYRGKNPSKAGFSQQINDREVVWISSNRLSVQYDSSAVRSDKMLPLVRMEKFLKWASHEVSRSEGEPIKAT